MLMLSREKKKTIPDNSICLFLVISTPYLIIKQSEYCFSPQIVHLFIQQQNTKIWFLPRMLLH